MPATHTAFGRAHYLAKHAALWRSAHGPWWPTLLPRPAPAQPPCSLIPRPEGEVALLVDGLGTGALVQGVATGCRLLQGLLVLKPRGQNRGLCLWPGTQRDTRGFSTISSSGMGGFAGHCPRPWTGWAPQGPPGQGVAEMKTLPYYKQRGLQALSPGLGGRLEGEAWPHEPSWGRVSSTLPSEGCYM